jgi:acetyl-CoA/propionyl-CoA carboxylase biotin carboxyl carrier protein
MFEVEVNRKLFRVSVSEIQDNRIRPRQQPPARSGAGRPAGNVLLSPMHGTVIALRAGPGDEVRSGQTVIVIEAMKMENEIAAHREGVVKTVDVSIGDTVETGQRLALIE